jgi:hypothetical protein
MKVFLAIFICLVQFATAARTQPVRERACSAISADGRQLMRVWAGASMVEQYKFTVELFVFQNQMESYKLVHRLHLKGGFPDEILFLEDKNLLVLASNFVDDPDTPRNLLTILKLKNNKMRAVYSLATDQLPKGLFTNIPSAEGYLFWCNGPIKYDRATHMLAFNTSPASLFGRDNWREMQMKLVRDARRWKLEDFTE